MFCSVGTVFNLALLNFSKWSVCHPSQCTSASHTSLRPDVRSSNRAAFGRNGGRPEFRQQEVLSRAGARARGVLVPPTLEEGVAISHAMGACCSVRKLIVVLTPNVALGLNARGTQAHQNRHTQLTRTTPARPARRVAKTYSRDSSRSSWQSRRCSVEVAVGRNLLDLRKLPLAVAQRADRARLQPTRDAIEVEHVPTAAPRDAVASVVSETGVCDGDSAGW